MGWNLNLSYWLTIQSTDSFFLSYFFGNKLFEDCVPEAVILGMDK